MDDSNQYYLLIVYVHHSMKNALLLNAEVCIKNITSYIKSDKCDCKGGVLGRCAHIAAILLMLSNHITENVCTTEKLSSSLPCSKNKGKKRDKDPKQLHVVSYESSKRKSEKSN